jgi:glycosyltransferase involved in cell wall biosynthesis
MNTPKISIITVVYNGELFIEKTIKSVLSQDNNLFEYIVIDGCSNDNTLAIINKYQSYISKIISEEDEGIYDAMNKGILYSKGEWLIFINAGDVFHSENTIANISKELISDFDFIYGNVEIDFGFIKKTLKAGDIKNLWKGMQFSHQSCFINANYHKLYLYNTFYKIASDFDLIFNSYKNKRTFKMLNITISTVISGGLSDTNQIMTIFEKYKIVLSKSNLPRNHLYYITILLVSILKLVLKKNLPNRFKNEIIKMKFRN